MQAADATTLGRTARWMLLFCTLFGLATMHTLGHAGMQMDSHAGVTSMSNAEAGPAHAAVLDIGATAAPCPDGHCGDGHGTGGMDAWSVCVAVLGGLAMVFLLGALLLSRRTGSARSPDRATGDPPAPRAPPGWRYQGLRVASLAVLRI
ncbi:DUF6153 family protein [Actinoplanes sp. NPDC004185]